MPSSSMLGSILQGAGRGATSLADLLMRGGERQQQQNWQQQMFDYKQQQDMLSNALAEKQLTSLDSYRQGQLEPTSPKPPTGEAGKLQWLMKNDPDAYRGYIKKITHISPSRATKTPKTAEELYASELDDALKLKEEALVPGSGIVVGEGENAREVLQETKTVPYDIPSASARADSTFYTKYPDSVLAGRKNPFKKTKPKQSKSMSFKQEAKPKNAEFELVDSFKKQGISLDKIDFDALKKDYPDLNIAAFKLRFKRK